jgi:prepilin-type N-terminal cleavage/methylation domain-containing protein
MTATSQQKFSASGFTLIELLVAMTISTALIVTLLALTQLTTKRFAHNQQELTHLSQARSLRHLFQAELATRLPATPLICETSPGFESSSRLAFIRTISPDAQDPLHPGDLTTCAYYLAFTADNDERESPKLFRKIFTPQETQLLIDAGDQATFPVPDPETDEAIAYHILAFHASPKYRVPETGELVAWEKTSAHPPSAVEITISQLSESASRRLHAPHQWQRVASSPSDSERPHIRTFTHLISLSH